MKRNTKQRWALCLIASLMLGMLQVGNPVSSQAADTSVVTEEDAAQVTAQDTAQNDYGLQNPRTDDDGVTTWDCITFGNYWQNDNNNDGMADKKDAKEPIKWRVLSVDGDDAFLLADKSLDYQKYNNIYEAENVTWETSTIRSWLKDTFLNDAFTESEQKAIRNTTVKNPNNPAYGTNGGNDTTDKVYLLSLDEVSNPSYGFSGTKTSVAGNTEYVRDTADVGNLIILTFRWWLRSPGETCYLASGVHDNGEIVQYGFNIYFDSNAIRPALHLNLSSTESWSKAETVSSGESIVIPTAKPSPTPAWCIPEITYDAAEFETFAGRTKEEAVQKYREARYAGQSYDDTDPASFYEKQPSFVAPYEPGTLSEDTLKTMTAFWNYYRWLVGSQDDKRVTGSYTNHETGWHGLQENAFIFNFWPNKPKDFPENVYWGASYSTDGYSKGDTPLEAIKNMINPKFSWEVVHNWYPIYKDREDLLYPYPGFFAMGFSGSWLVKEPIDGGDDEEISLKKELFYAFPSEGYMPSELLPADEMGWSVRVDYKKLRIPKEKDVTVTIVHRESGEKFVRKYENENAYTDHYNTITFLGPTVENSSVYTGTYDVEITGLLDVATGKGAKICYTVNFFDGAEYLRPSEVEEVSVDGITKFVVPKEIATTDNLKKFAAILPREVTVTAENGRKVILPVKGDWVYDEAGSCWKNSVDVKRPEGIADTSGLLSDFSIACEVGDNRGLTFKMSWLQYSSWEVPDIAEDGRGGWITITWNETSKFDHAVLYHMTESEQGGYTANARFNPETATYDPFAAAYWEDSPAENNFVFGAFYFIKDTGDYVAVGYVDGEKTAYFSNNIIPLVVMEKIPEKVPNTSQTGNTGGGNSGGSSTDIGTGTGESSNAGGTGSTAGTGNTTGDNDSEYDSGEDIETDNTDEDSTAPKIAKVKNLKVKAKKKSAVLTWKKMSGVSGYQICYSTSKKWKGGKNKSSKKNKVTIKGLKKKKTYYFRVRAYAKAGGKTVYGSWSEKKSIKVKK